MPALDGAEIVVLLLPNTAETENVLNAETIAPLAPGAVVINPGRGHADRRRRAARGAR